jgi:hypothetical protein
MAVTTVNHDRIWPLLANTFHNPFHVGNNLPASRVLAGQKYCGDQFARNTFIVIPIFVATGDLKYPLGAEFIDTVHNRR